MFNLIISYDYKFIFDCDEIGREKLGLEPLQKLTLIADNALAMVSKKVNVTLEFVEIVDSIVKKLLIRSLFALKTLRWHLRTSSLPNT